MSQFATPSKEDHEKLINPGLAAGSQKPEAGQFGIGKDTDTQGRVLERAESEPQRQKKAKDDSDQPTSL